MNQPLNKLGLDRRRAGILLHITSLPGPAECGDLGPDAYRFVDFIQQTGFSVWQILPVGPTQADGSPYQSSSMHAGNPRLISISELADLALLPPEFVHKEQIGEADKKRLLRAAWKEFQANPRPELRSELDLFITETSAWLEDYTLFRALWEENGHRCWWRWPAPLRDRDPAALKAARRRLAAAVEYIRFEQFLFFRQWLRLKRYANQRGVLLFGDMPIFVAHDSAEVWAHRDLFELDDEGHPLVVAGVPPDYFSATGQRWGNPLYRWDKLEQDGFAFWVDRMKTQLDLFDLIRVDHFRGFEAYWEIPAVNEHAIDGRWVKVPGERLFEQLHDIYDPLPLIAEDLGFITPEVDALRRKFELPGMKILQFAFSGGADNPYLPFRHEINSVTYTGTHDNDTTLGWYLGLDDDSRLYVDEYLGRSREAMPWPMIRQALASRSQLAVIPMQDLLALGSEHRMNLPGTVEGNWRWRFQWEQVDQDLPRKLRSRGELYGRIPPG
ncbi:MAG: 4-alpha-glucanotransferase [Gammaproteobacteria bacterium]|nr:4-alpha-glucanotransferase [Gammaproteobacteria bacterium]